jgi:hypothetical protein
MGIVVFLFLYCSIFPFYSNSKAYFYDIIFEEFKERKQIPSLMMSKSGERNLVPVPVTPIQPLKDDKETSVVEKELKKKANKMLNLIRKAFQSYSPQPQSNKTLNSLTITASQLNIVNDDYEFSYEEDSDSYSDNVITDVDETETEEFADDEQQIFQLDD